jgi:2-phosphosulfolactate phosphatase
VPERGRYSLSPHTFDQIRNGEKVVLWSLNGAVCSRHCANAPYIFAGALVNASAVAAAVSTLLEKSDREVTIIACGEREGEPKPGGDLRMAIEDYVAAGAIIAGINREKSPEARVCEAAFLASAGDLKELLWESVSGRELRAKGFGDDVIFAARKDEIPAVPIFKEGAFGKLE